MPVSNDLSVWMRVSRHITSRFCWVQCERQRLKAKIIQFPCFAGSPHKRGQKLTHRLLTGTIFAGSPCEWGYIAAMIQQKYLALLCFVSKAGMTKCTWFSRTSPWKRIQKRLTPPFIFAHAVLSLLLFPRVSVRATAGIKKRRHWQGNRLLHGILRQRQRINAGLSFAESIWVVVTGMSWLAWLGSVWKMSAVSGISHFAGLCVTDGRRFWLYKFISDCSNNQDLEQHPIPLVYSLNTFCRTSESQYSDK